MLKIQCPKCNKSFLWTDEMSTTGKCSTPECDWLYDIHTELSRNVAHHGVTQESKTLHCPFCEAEIASRLAICSKCGRVVLGNKAFQKSYVFLAVCLILVLLSYILNYWMK